MQTTVVSLPQHICFHGGVARLTDYGTMNGRQQVLPVTTANQTTQTTHQLTEEQGIRYRFRQQDLGVFQIARVSFN